MRPLSGLMFYALAALAALALADAVAATVLAGRAPETLGIAGGLLDRGTVIVASLALFALGCATVTARAPLGLKLLAAALELYAGVGLVVAALAGHGTLAAVGANDPYPFDVAWLRASVAAGALVLPLGGLAALAAAAALLVRGRVPRAVGSAALALTAACAAQSLGIGLAAAGLPTPVAFESLGGAAGGDRAPVDVAFPDTVAPNVRTEAARLGPDGRAAFARVAGLADEAYPGALRGASGTLWAGGGNALDKALLLRDLLRANDPNAELRFAWCTLGAADAQAFAATLLAAHRQRPPVTLEQADRIAAAAQGPAMQAVMRQWASAWHGLVGIVRGESTALAPSFAGTALAGAEQFPPLVAAAVSRHVWLEQRTGSTWTELDPTLGATGFGRSRCGAAATGSAPPDDAFARVEVRLRIAERSGGIERTRDVLAARLRVADLPGRNLAVFFAEPNGLGAAPSPAPGSPAPGAPTDLTYTPILRAGDQAVTGTTFGVPRPPTGPGISQTTKSAAEGAASILDQVGASPSPSAAPSATPAPQAELTAAWLRVTVLAPGRVANTVTTALFDRVGAAARASNATGAQPAALPLAGGEVAPLTAIWNIAVWSGALAGGVGDPTGTLDPSATEGPDAIAAALGQAHSRLAPLRMALFEAASGTPPGYVTAAPSVTFLASGGGLDQEVAGLGVLADVASDDVRIIAPPPGASAASAEAAWAVASVMAERLVADGATEFLVGAPAPTAIDGNDAVATFAAARHNGSAFSTLDAAHRGAVASVAASDDVRALLAADVDAGRTVVLPGSPAIGTQLAWFSADPAIGTIRDTMASGRHQELEEEEVETEEEVRQVPWWRRFGKKVACTVSAAGAVLALAAGDPSAAWSMAKIPAKIAAEEEKWRKVGEAACKATGGGEGGGAGPGP